MKYNSEDIVKKKENSIWLKNYFLSILIHLILMFSSIYLFNWSSNQSRINSVIFSLDTNEYLTEKYVNHEKKYEKQSAEDKLSQEESKEPIKEIKTLSFADIAADTTNLDQIYSELSFGLSINYPKGWTFIDQNKKNKLDGVTFWASDLDIVPPPYVHLEVVDKDLFIEKRYQYKVEMDDFIAFYNDVEETQGYFSQVFYLKTDIDVDFRLKLMIKGKSGFDNFLPRFWGILKSFRLEQRIF